MNNHRLLTGLLSAILLSSGVCANAQEIVTLEEIFAIAEANSAQLRPALTACDEAEHEISVARSSRLPEIKATLTASYIGDGFTTQRDFTDYQRAPIPHLGTGLGISIEQPVYTGGAITASIEMAEMKSAASRFAADLKRDNIRFRLAGYYLDIHRYENLLSVMNSNIASAKHVLADMKARYEQGLVLLNDITRYELLVSNLELQRTKIINTIEILNHDLVMTAGLPETTVIRTDTTILERSLPMAGEEEWRQKAEENSPVLALARNGIEISRRGEALAKSERLPKIGIQAAWTLDGPILVEIPPINRNLSYWYVGVGVSYNLSSLYKTNKKLSVSRAATRKSVEELAAAVEETDLAVRADHIRYLEAYDELRTRQKGVELADRNYRTIATRYTQGMALITEMLDAADARLLAEQQLVDSRINIIYQYYKLLFTTGTI